MTIAVKVEHLGKRFLLGESIEHTLSSRVGDLLRGRVRRSAGREEFWALRDVNFEVKEGEALGIIGGNGAGKSTLLKVLSRITPPTEGRARVKGRLSSLLEVGTGFHPELTGRENVFLNGAILGMRKAEVQRKFDEIVAFSGVEKFIDTPVKRYSSGMYVRLAFAVAAHLEPDVLIIDEVLAVGDADFQKRCLGKMNDVAKQGRTVLFVSHNMAAVQKLCSQAIWMRGGQVAAKGATGQVVSSYLQGLQARDSQADGMPVGTLYARQSADSDPSGATLLAIELLDGSGNPCEAVATWEPMTLRLRFRLDSAMRSFSPDLQICTVDGVVLTRTSASPDRGPPLSMEPGTYEMDCRFESLPLAAGDYPINVRMTIPKVEPISRVDGACALTVMPADIFGTGLPPASPRYLMATRHDWSPVRRQSS
ncbi:MAG: ABC transporter ATP-binding protein [Thermomonas sp.]|uniref:ABC transporter ATP-binding protein n=1 Tax=Thermomonas sp. TaxID=1971895 RepID=UPI001D727FD5|nr:ABC transporter ATP-binding protein [Thermomonas sp.]MBZ0087640.1 ABC transporter ATP-binding protein [Thermomonas sp.]